MSKDRETTPESQSAAIRPHGGYRDLIAFLIAGIVYDGTVVLCGRAFRTGSRMSEQMIQAARSGKQNIAEGSRASAASQKPEIFLVNCARGSLEELLLDFEDYLRQNGLTQWKKDDAKAVHIRKLHALPNRSYATYRPYIEDKSMESSANTLICLCHQANYLLDRLLKRLEQDVIAKGGFSERLRRARLEYLKRNR